MTTKEVRNKNPRKLRAGRAFGDLLSVPSFYKDGARSSEVPRVRNPQPPAHRPSPILRRPMVSPSTRVGNTQLVNSCSTRFLPNSFLGPEWWMDSHHCLWDVRWDLLSYAFLWVQREKQNERSIGYFFGGNRPDSELWFSWKNRSRKRYVLTLCEVSCLSLQPYHLYVTLSFIGHIFSPWKSEKTHIYVSWSLI